MSTSVLLVRHAEPVVDASVHPAEWALTPVGLTAARTLGQKLAGELGRRIVAASGERKSLETAAAMMGNVDDVLLDGRLGEVRRPWMETGHREAVWAYLGGAQLPGWETRGEAVTRFRECIEALPSGDVALVTHGTVMTLFVASVVSGLDAPTFWSQLTMPDAWMLDPSAGTVSRPEALST